MSFLKKFLNNLSEKSYDEKIRETKINLKKKQVNEYLAEYEPLSAIEYFWSKFGTNETFFGLSYKDYRSDYEKEYKERIVEVEQKNWSVKYEKESIEKHYKTKRKALDNHPLRNKEELRENWRKTDRKRRKELNNYPNLNNYPKLKNYKRIADVRRWLSQNPPPNFYLLSEKQQLLIVIINGRDNGVPQSMEETATTLGITVQEAGEQYLSLLEKVSELYSMGKIVNIRLCKDDIEKLDIDK